MSAPAERSFSPFTTTVGELVKGPLQTIRADRTVGEAARRMTEARVGSLVVMDPHDRPVGMLTKTDLVRRVLSPGLAPGQAVAKVMSTELHAVEAGQPLFEGLLQMVRHHIGHVLVTEGGRITGVISERDWLMFQAHYPIALMHAIDHATDVGELARLRQRGGEVIRRFFGEEGTADSLTQFVTELNDRITRRLLDLTLAAMRDEGAGEPPVAFAWIAMGSEGRKEQTLATDQDNGLLFADVPQEAFRATQDWFLRFAQRVVEGLVTCGFPRCKGNVMASNPALCQPLQGWQRTFARLIGDPDPEALVKASIYFDFRAIYGDATLADALWDDLLARIQRNRGFLRHKAGILMESRPPVYAFAWRLRRVLGLMPGTVDLKRQALTPLVHALRMLALAHGVRETNTLRRLEQVQTHDALPKPLAESVRSAYDFVMLLRVRRHFAQAARGEAPRNEVNLRQLNPLQASFLVASLRTIAHLQDHVFHEYGGLELG